MIYKNVELYNVEELTETPEGYHMLRVPDRIRRTLNDTAKRTAWDCTGVELRFKFKEGCDRVKITLSQPDGTACCAWVYYGSFQAGWQESEKYILKEPTVIEINRLTENYDVLKKIEKERNLPYNTDVVRLILPGNNINLIDIEGECVPPEPADVPKLRYLAYGSSITHGSLSLTIPSAYAERTARRLGVDVINLGFSGSCHIEETMADYIASRNDWDFATLELGINIADALTRDEFCRRCRYMINTVALAHPDKQIICTDAFTSLFDVGIDGEYWFREALAEVNRELALPNVHYINGRQLMKDYVTLSADMAHPDVDGQEEISDNLIKVIRQYVKL